MDCQRKMPQDLVGKVREQPAHDGLEAFWASGFVHSLALVPGFGLGLRFPGRTGGCTGHQKAAAKSVT